MIPQNIDFFIKQISMVFYIDNVATIRIKELSKFLL